MRPNCQNCEFEKKLRPKVVRIGTYFRTSDSREIQRFRCKGCQKGFSVATFQKAYRQKKRQKNETLRRLLCSGVSQRRAAKLLSLNRITVVRKFLFLAIQAEFELRAGNLRKPKAQTVEFDDLETIEHAKNRPLAVTLMVESRTRRILGLEVSRMRAKGRLARGNREGEVRIDERKYGRENLFRRVKELVSEELEIRSDSNPYYRRTVEKHFPKASYRQFLGKRGSLGGQGELKQVRFDPIFSLNHTCAMLRANVNRLIRKTWCTTKKKDRLYAHLIIYAAYHNTHLI